MKRIVAGLLFFSLALPRLFGHPLDSNTLSDIDGYLNELVKSHRGGVFKDPAITGRLARRLKDETVPPLIRERMAWALGQLNARGRVETLTEAAESKNLFVRSAALGALLHMRARTALAVYIRIAKTDPVLHMRQKATIALGLLRWDKAIKPLVDLSSDPAVEIRGAAALGMAATHSQKNSFKELLATDMIHDPSPYVSSRVKLALDVVNRNRTNVRTHFKYPDPDIRLFAALFFHYHGRETDLGFLREQVKKDSDEEVKFELGRAIAKIKKEALRRRQKKPAGP